MVQRVPRGGVPRPGPLQHRLERERLLRVERLDRGPVVVGVAAEVVLLLADEAEGGGHPQDPPEHPEHQLERVSGGKVVRRRRNGAKKSMAGERFTWHSRAPAW